MAKRKATMKAAEPEGLTVVLRRQIMALRPQFTAFTTQFAALSVSRGTLAPVFMRVYGAYVQQSNGGTFVNFVRLLDSEVPSERAAYRSHKSYQAADYLRRLVGQRNTGRRTPATRSNLTALARTIATIVPILRDANIIWRAVEQEFGFTARQMTRLRAVVAEAQPLLALPGHAKGQARVIHVAQPLNAAETAAA